MSVQNLPHDKSNASTGVQYIRVRRIPAIFLGYFASLYRVCKDVVDFRGVHDLPIMGRQLSKRIDSQDDNALSSIFCYDNRLIERSVVPFAKILGQLGGCNGDHLSNLIFPFPQNTEHPLNRQEPSTRAAPFDAHVSNSGRAVGENVRFLEAGQIQPNSIGQIQEGGARQPVATLAREHRVELFAQSMQEEHVGGGIGELRLAERLRAPVRRLLLLGNLNPEQFAGEVLKSVPVGIGPRQLGGDLGAIDRRRHHAERVAQRRHVETAEVKQLQHVRVREQLLEPRRARLSAPDLHDVRAAVAAGELDDAEPIALDLEAERLRVDRDDRAEIELGGQVPLMEADRHRGVAQRDEYACKYLICNILWFPRSPQR